MKIKDSTQRYGFMTKILHWTTAILFICQYYWVYWKRYVLPEKSELGVYYIRGLHKPIGVCILIIGIFFIAWRIMNSRPAPPAHSPAWERRAAKLTHAFLYLSMLVMPLSGILMSMAGGYPIDMFGQFQLPMLIAKNKELSSALYQVHELTSYVVIGLFTLHVIAALKHHWIDKDNILVRILPFGR